jgi:hypothetical protein
MYEYEFGFYILQTLRHTKLNEKDDDDDKYIMGVHRIEKENPSEEAFIVDGVMKIIRYPNFFTPSENDLAKKLTKDQDPER